MRVHLNAVKLRTIKENGKLLFQESLYCIGRRVLSYKHSFRVKHLNNNNVIIIIKIMTKIINIKHYCTFKISNLLTEIYLKYGQEEKSYYAITMQREKEQ